MSSKGFIYSCLIVFVLTLDRLLYVNSLMFDFVL